MGTGRLLEAKLRGTELEVLINRLLTVIPFVVSKTPRMISLDKNYLVKSL